MGLRSGVAATFMALGREDGLAWDTSPSAMNRATTPIRVSYYCVKQQYRAAMPSFRTFFDISSDLHLQNRVEIGQLTTGQASQAQHCFTQMGGGALDCTTFVNKPLETRIKMKAAFATLTFREMLPYCYNFLDSEFPVNIEMKTSNSLKTTHTIHSIFSCIGSSLFCLF
jgi:hypothetical protein